MGRLRTALQVFAIVGFLYGLAALSPAIVQPVFGYQVKDPGVAWLLSSAYLVLGVIGWGVASNVERAPGLATYVLIGLLVFTVFNLWGWFIAAYFTARNALVPVIINLVMIGWIWTTRGKAAA